MSSILEPAKTEPLMRKVYVYRPGTAVCCLDDPETLSGDPGLPELVLALRKIWA